MSLAFVFGNVNNRCRYRTLFIMCSSYSSLPLDVVECFAARSCHTTAPQVSKLASWQVGKLASWQQARKERWGNEGFRARKTYSARCMRRAVSTSATATAEFQGTGLDTTACRNASEHALWVVRSIALAVVLAPQELPLTSAVQAFICRELTEFAQRVSWNF